MIYYVSTKGSDYQEGTRTAPFRTINHAAEIAVAGDIVRVFGGTYREWVDPKCGGTSDFNRIIYEAVEGEHPIIKGSEIITGWEKENGTVWKKVITNEIFGDFNPYAKEVEGDWLANPFFEDYRVHLGDVYVNGQSFFEAKSLEDLYDNTPRTVGYQHPVRIGEDLIRYPERTIYKWYAEVSPDCTTLYCNFQQYDPNTVLVEINVRPCCFYPKTTGINYITLRGFEFAQAACPWAPPTSHQIGMIGPHWSKGWIIENNHIHDAKCSAISLGKEETTGHNLYTRFGRKSAHRNQLEAVFAALKKGWSRETVGSHIVRNNEIHDCGQNGIVGHMGCIFSIIEHNHIYNIGKKHEFFGYEMGGIKLHCPLDVVIRNNNIHHCIYGTWLDWEAQGARVTANLFYANTCDLMVEVSHGPYCVDHNILLSPLAFTNWSQGGAFIHNLICGQIYQRKVLERQTPYHYPHSTMVAGYTHTYGGDDRYYNNIFAGLVENSDIGAVRWGNPIDSYSQFTAFCDQFSDPNQYWDLIAAEPKEEFKKFTNIPQPIWLKDNAYSGNAVPSVHEKNPTVADGLSLQITENNGEWTLQVDVPAQFVEMNCEPVTTERLGEPRIAAMPFDAPDGSPLDFSKDFVGNIHDDQLFPGPFAVLKAGKQTIKLW